MRRLLGHWIARLRAFSERDDSRVQQRELLPQRIEFRLLSLLARHAGRVLTHRQILQEVWGPNAKAHTHYLRVYMAQLRRKIEPEPARPRWLVTEPDVGYRLREEP